MAIAADASVSCSWRWHPNIITEANIKIEGLPSLGRAALDRMGKHWINTGPTLLVKHLIQRHDWTLIYWYPDWPVKSQSWACRFFFVFFFCKPKFKKWIMSSNTQEYGRKSVLIKWLSCCEYGFALCSVVVPMRSIVVRSFFTSECYILHANISNSWSRKLQNDRYFTLPLTNLIFVRLKYNGQIFYTYCYKLTGQFSGFPSSWQSSCLGCLYLGC